MMTDEAPYQNIGYGLWARGSNPVPKKRGTITYIDSLTGATYIRMKETLVYSSYIIDSKVGSKVEFDLTHDEEGAPYAIGARVVESAA